MKRDQHQTTVYVVYPAALFDGWEIVKEHDDAPVFFETCEAAIAYADARAAMDGGALVKMENWFGDTERVREVRSGAFAGRIARVGERRFGERRHARTCPVPPSGDARRADRRQRTSSE
jgi:hypothetical protein